MGKVILQPFCLRCPAKATLLSDITLSQMGVAAASAFQQAMAIHKKKKDLWILQ